MGLRLTSKQKHVQIKDLGMVIIGSLFVLPSKASLWRPVKFQLSKTCRSLPVVAILYMRQLNDQGAAGPREVAQATSLSPSVPLRKAQVLNGPQPACSKKSWISEDLYAGCKAHFKNIFSLGKQQQHCAMDVIRLWIRSDYILQVFSLRFREKKLHKVF